MANLLAKMLAIGTWLFTQTRALILMTENFLCMPTILKCSCDFHLAWGAILEAKGRATMFLPFAQSFTLLFTLDLFMVWISIVAQAIAHMPTLQAVGTWVFTTSFWCKQSKVLRLLDFKHFLWMVLAVDIEYTSNTASLFHV